MDCGQAALTLFLLVPCDQVGGEPINIVIADALAAPARTEADRLQDPLRRPDLVLEFFEIRPGMTVLDLFSGGGYYSEIVSRVVGRDGKVLAHNNDAYLAFASASLAGRYDEDRLPNVERVVVEADDLVLPPEEFDAALVMLTWHDFYVADAANGWPAIDRTLLLSKLCSAVRPGGVLGITDHVAVTGSPVEQTAEALHRIDPQRIRDDLAGSCFEYEGEIEVLRNPADDHSQAVFAEGIRGRTDRVVYRFRRRA